MDKQINKYFELNKKSWNKRTSYHLNSDFYDLYNFKKSINSLKHIELEALGNLKDKSILHLQCHFGMDSISLANLGAKVTAVDFSSEAIKNGKELSKELETPVNFICSNVYDLCLSEEYDIVFVSYGAICWLNDLGLWAKVINLHLKKGGFFYIVDFHPVLGMFDDKIDKIKYEYFNKKACVENIQGTYAEKNIKVYFDNIEWSHSMSEVIGSLLSQNLTLMNFQEFDYSTYNCFEDLYQLEKEKFKFKNIKIDIPILFSLKFKK